MELISFILQLGAVQKIRVQMGGRGGYSKMTQNVTVGGGGVLEFNTC
jgi:hypothetical protein